MGHKFIVDATSTLNGTPSGIFDEFWGTEYSSFEQLAEKVKKAGYTMGIPERGEDWGANRAGVDIIRDGKIIGTMSFEADVDLTQGSILNRKKSRLTDGKTTR